MKTSVPLSKQYLDAMRDGDYARCIRIEETHGLYGLPPEIVSAALVKIDAGEDPADAIDELLERE